jgi:uncharacterized protein YhdP
MLAQAPGRIRHLAWLLIQASAVAAAAMTALAAAALLALHFWIWPSMSDRQAVWLSEFQSQMSQRGLSVSVQALDADWETWFRPRIRIAQLEVARPNGDRVLAIREIQAVLGLRSIASLLHWAPVFSEIRLQDPQLYAERDAKGEVIVAGIALAGNQSDPELLNWLLRQGRLRLDGGEIIWRDVIRSRSVRLRELTFAMNNLGVSHAWALKATPPSILGEGFVLQGDFRHALGGSPANLQEWVGEAYVQFDRVNLSELTQFVHLPQAAPLRVNSGQGALRAWIKLDSGTLEDLTVDLDLTDASLQWGTPKRPMLLRRLTGRAQTRLADREQKVSLTNVHLESSQLKAPAHIPSAELNVRQKSGAGNLSAQVAAKAIDLSAAMWFLEHIPLPSDWRSTLSGLQPAGSLIDFRLAWDEEGDVAKRFAIESGFENLSLASLGRRPGFSQASGSIKANEQSGELTLASRSGGLSFPGIFESAGFRFDRLDAQIGWSAKHLLGAAHDQQPTAEFTIRRLAVANSDLAIEASGAYRWRSGSLGEADLAGKITRAEFNKIVDYVPKVVGSETRSWLKQYLISAKNTSASFELRGPLERFPFRDPSEGKFVVVAQTEAAVIRPMAGWPLINNIRAQVIFDRHQFRTVAKGARMGPLGLSGITARIDDLESNEPLLMVDGVISGDFQSLIDIANQSPVRQMLGELTADMRAKGQASLELGLRLDLSVVDRSQINGKLSTAKSGFRYAQGLPEISIAAADVGFNQSGITAFHLQGQALGGPLRVSSRPAERSPSGSAAPLTISVDGQAVGPALERWTEEAIGLPIKNTLTGSARYSAAVELHEASIRTVIRSSLEGLGSTLPGSFRKRPQDDWGLRVDLLHQQPRPGASAASAQTWTISSNQQQLNARVQRSLTARKETLIDIDSRQLAGQFRWMPSVSAVKSAKAARSQPLMQARLSRLWLDAPGREDSMPQEDASDGVAQEWPTVDLVVDDFRVGERAWGRLEVQASPVAATRSWEISRFSVANSDAELSGQGQWATLTQGRQRRSRTSLNLELRVNNGGALLARSGYPKVIRDTKGKIEGRLHWPGSPLDFSGAALNGNLSLNLEQGQFLKADPGLARLVSVVNLQSLPRRIKLDFRDIFSEGFTYERIRGDLQFLNGQASTQNLRIIGVQASVMLEGTADIRRETQDLRVLVLPEFNAGLASLGYAALVNPAVGLGAFVAQYILRNPVRELLSYEYRVTGSWEDPVVESARRELRSNTPEIKAK